jgi:hypothetical protein
MAWRSRRFAHTFLTFVLLGGLVLTMAALQRLFTDI